ncbi:sigma-54-dependent Fis family transcriptional regulator [Beijerinckia sp. L45]|uniref:sigma-54-dependent Fis family transcriptional regulator n=1 Tax=Beijerinckia sp. L45 TaxID=1641855 RepID=UPI001FEDB92E|nr:sigma-54-dependent Fis family transcriptional regulator [Beijerinckia sp. L45]
MAESDRTVHVPSRFTGRQTLSKTGIAPSTTPIQRSWQRCANLGLDQEARPLLAPLPEQALREAVGRNEALRRRCRPEFEALFARTRNDDSIVILTDAEGLVLDAIGSAAFADRAAQVALQPGVSWAEPATGTNAIGTALVERRAIAVQGAEHFFKRNRILSCAAVPILDATGQLLGVLDLSGNAQADHQHALSRVQTAVDAIEHRVFDTAFPGCDVVRLHADATMLGTTREGVLVFRDQVLVAANRYGLALLNLDWQTLGRRSYHALFPMQQSVGASGVLLRDPAGRLIHSRQPDRARPHLPPAKHKDEPKPQQPNGPAHFFDKNGQARLSRAVRLLDAGVPLLVQGETGTGKEVFARAAHAASARASKAFVAINCTALPESLIEAELFGYEAGAFTGARRAGAKGLLREADGGLLFLDEIGDMPLALQPRLLRALQEREVVPVGAVQATPIDVTLICATHRDLAKLVEDGAFRADLYFRIASYTVDLPTLRSFDDRAALLHRMWASLEPERRRITLSPDCAAALATYTWPGNFRQLVGSLRAMLALAEPDEELGLDALPSNLRAPRAAEVNGRAEHDDPARFDSIARDAMRNAVRASKGNVSEAARRLGISRSTLYRRCLSDGPLR